LLRQIKLIGKPFKTFGQFATGMFRVEIFDQRRALGPPLLFILLVFTIGTLPIENLWLLSESKEKII
jgi:hypothetical protein